MRLACHITKKVLKPFYSVQFRISFGRHFSNWPPTKTNETALLVVSGLDFVTNLFQLQTFTFSFPFPFSFMKILWSNHVVHVDSLLWWWALWLVKIMMQNQEAIIPPPLLVIPHQVWLLQQRIADFPQLDGFFVFLHSSISWPSCLFGFCTRM